MDKRTARKMKRKLQKNYGVEFDLAELEKQNEDFREYNGNRIFVLEKDQKTFYTVVKKVGWRLEVIANEFEEV